MELRLFFYCGILLSSFLFTIPGAYFNTYLVHISASTLDCAYFSTQSRKKTTNICLALCTGTPTWPFYACVALGNHTLWQWSLLIIDVQIGTGVLQDYPWWARIFLNLGYEKLMAQASSYRTWFVKFSKTDSKMFLLEHLRYSFKPMCFWCFFSMGQKGLVSTTAKAETPRFYHIGMSEEQISHSHQERLSQGQILHKGIRIHPSSLCIELIDMNRKGHAIAWCKMCITFKSYQVCILAIPRYNLKHTQRYLQDIDFHFDKWWLFFPRKTLVAYLSPLYTQHLQ